MIVNQEEALASIRRERQNLEWLNKSLSSLREKFGDRYIAVQDRQVIDSDEHFERLLARIRKLEHPESVMIEYVTALEYLWML